MGLFSTRLDFTGELSSVRNDTNTSVRLIDLNRFTNLIIASRTSLDRDRVAMQQRVLEVIFPNAT